MIPITLKCPFGEGFQHIEPDFSLVNHTGIPGTAAFSFKFFQRTP